MKIFFREKYFQYSA